MTNNLSIIKNDFYITINSLKHHFLIKKTCFRRLDIFFSRIALSNHWISKTAWSWLCKIRFRSLAALGKGFFCVFRGCSPVCSAEKKMSITLADVIEKLGLFAAKPGFNLTLFGSSDINRVTSPGTNRKQSLASHALRDDSSLLLRNRMAWASCPPSTPASSVGRGFFLPGRTWRPSACPYK